jgi:hypothetical protein
MIRKFVVALSIVIGMVVGSLAPAGATEPQMELFAPDRLIKMISGKPDFFKCKSSWDPSSNKTEVFARCTNAYAEAYIHGNAVPFGDDGNFWQGGVSYASFTVKKSDSYPRLEALSQLCEGMVGGTNMKVSLEAKDWFVKNYKKVANKKKLTKVFNGYNMSIIGGSGPIRTVTCGAKPSK